MLVSRLINSLISNHNLYTELSFGFLSRLISMNCTGHSFNNKSDVYDMAEAFITESEEEEMDFPIHPRPLSRNIKIQINN
jgi:hypothetical protein